MPDTQLPSAHIPYRLCQIRVPYRLFPTFPPHRIRLIWIGQSIYRWLSTVVRQFYPRYPHQIPTLHCGTVCPLTYSRCNLCTPLAHRIFQCLDCLYMLCRRLHCWLLNHHFRTPINALSYRLRCVLLICFAYSFLNAVWRRYLCRYVQQWQCYIQCCYYCR